MSHHPIIGCRYQGISWDRPSLRQLPRGWTLEETRLAQRPPLWMQAERWLKIIISCLLLLGCVQMALAVMA